MQLPNKPLKSAIEAIGNTPLVELARITKRVNGRILVKLENLNPGYSKKDRIARQIIADAEASGELAPGQTVVELTSGNTGTGLAIVCGIKGYPFVAVNLMFSAILLAPRDLLQVVPQHLKNITLK